MLRVKTFPGERQHTRLLTPGRETRTDQSTDTTIVQLDEPQILLGLQEYG